MSAAASAASALPVSALPPIDPAREPAVVRDGNKAAKNAYATGMAFEDVLVSELSQQLLATVPGLDGSSDTDGLGGSDTDGLGGSTDDGSSSSSPISGYSSLLSDTLTSSIMSSGGTGMALQIAESIDPAMTRGTS